MHRDSIRNSLLGLIAAGLLLAAQSACAQSAPPRDLAIADYQAKLVQYQKARFAYEEEASAYWDQVIEKRRTRNAKRRDHLPIQLADYVLSQPPVYAGPPRPVNPAGLPPEEKPPIPLIADFLKAAAEAAFA